MAAVTISLCLFTLALPAADPQLMSLVMPEAKVLGGFNVEQAKTSPFGQYLIQQIQSNDKGLQELINATGFDPRRDVREVVVSSSGEPTHKSGLALVRGNFDVPRILAAAQAKGQNSVQYRGVEILSNKDSSESLAFVDSTLVIAGDSANVRAAIDRRSAPAALNPELAVKAGQLSTSQDGWVVSLVPLSTLNHAPSNPNAQGPLNADLFKNIQQTSGGVKFGANIVVSAEAVAQTDKDASALVDVIRFLINMAQLNAPQGNSNAAPFASLLQSINVAAEGNVVKASISIPEDQIELLAKPHPRVKREKTIQQ